MILSCQACVALCCALCLVTATLSRAEFALAYVREHSLIICTCVQDLVACSVISSSECDCSNRQLPDRQQDGGADSMSFKRLTVWYTSPLNAARLLNNSEIRHLALVMCDSTGHESLHFSRFTVQRLERLTISYPFLRPGQSQDMVLGRDMAAPHQEEPRIAVIDTSVLLGKAGLKAYTVKTKMDSNNMLPFPNVFISHMWLPQESCIFVTFLY